MANPSRMKREIDKAKKEKAAEKRERRQKTGDADQGDTNNTADGHASVSTDELLGQLERIHAQFANEEIDFEEFERAKDALIAQLAMG
jgi:hypothetical protein